MDQSSSNLSVSYAPLVYQNPNAEILNRFQPVMVNVPSQAIAIAMQLSSRRRRRRNVEESFSNSLTTTEQIPTINPQTQPAAVRVVFLAYRSSSDLFPSNEESSWVC